MRSAQSWSWSRPACSTTITITAAATGGPAADTFINVTMPSGLTARSANVASGHCDTIDNLVGCELGSIPAGASKAIQIVATGSGAAGTRAVSATASTSSQDSNAANNAASSSVTVAGVGVPLNVSSGNLATPIPDLSTVDVPVDVFAEGSVVRAQAYVRLDHTFDSDLQLYLIAPDGKTVALSLNNGGGGDNYGSGANSCSSTMTRFDDFQATSIVAGAPPFAGSLKPQQALSAMVGEPSDGQWKLRVKDVAGGDSGTLGCFILGLTTVP